VTLLKQYQELITPEILAARLHFLASDLFEGRENGDARAEYPDIDVKRGLRFVELHGIPKSGLDCVS
jgi:hypothetical protein